MVKRASALWAACAACAALAAPLPTSVSSAEALRPAPQPAQAAPSVGLTEISLPLAEVLLAASADLAQLGPAGAGYVVSSAPEADTFSSYISWMVTAHLERRGLAVHRSDAALPLGGGKPPDRLPAALAGKLRVVGGDLFVQTAATVEEGQQRLIAVAYGISDGALRMEAGRPFHLPAQMEFLLSAERVRMNRRDTDWLELFDAMFPTMPQGVGPGTEPGLPLAEAQFFFNAGLWSKAAPLFLSAAGEAPNWCFMRGMLALQLGGNGDRAYQAVRTGLKRYPDSGPLYALRAWLSLRQKRTDDALMWLEQARLCGMATEGLYRYAAGLVALEQKDDARAEQELGRAADLLPEALFAQLQMARFCRDRAELDRAVRYYGRASASAKATAEVWGEFAVALEAAGNVDEAIQALRNAFLMETGNLGITRHLAALLKRKGQHQEGLDVMRRAAEANPRSPSVWAAYGDAAAEMWMVGLAEQAYQESLKVNSEFPYGKVRLAALLTSQYRFAEARTMLAELLAARPTYDPARIQLGRTLGRIGFVDQAVSVLNAVVTEPEHEVNARLALVEIHIAAGRLPEAVACAQIAASSRPDAQTCLALCDAFLASGDFAKAESAAAMGVQKEPGSALARLAVGRVLQAKGKPEDALKEAGRALELNPYLVEALDLAGSAWQTLGDFQRCAEYWQRALACNPWHAELHRRLGDVLGPKLHDWAGTHEHLTRYVELERMRAAASH